MDQWVRVHDAKPSSGGQAPRAARRPPSRERHQLPEGVATEIRSAASAATARHRDVLVQKVEDAAEAYERNRYAEAVRLGKPVTDEVPQVAAVRELVGLAAYRAGRWREAVRQLDAYGELTGEVDYVPLVMDCHRALGRPRKVADLFTDLRQQSPSADTLSEARLVAAGSLADQGDLAGAISLLTGAGAAKTLRNPADRHLRQWFALADLYERAGDVPRARELYLRVQQVDRDAYGVRDRLDALGGTRVRKRAAPARGATAGRTRGPKGGVAPR
jgi:tetratricopeptide (TPR) repeat protein